MLLAMLPSRLFGRPGTWPRVRRSLCASAKDASETFVDTVAEGLTRLSPCVVCRRLRNDKYVADPRWASTARHEGYARLFADDKWWPAYLRERCSRPSTPKP